MIILGIDPGTTESGWVLYDSDSHSIVNKGISENDSLLVHTMYDDDIDVMAIEMVASYGMPVGKEVFETVYWIGRFCQASHRSGRPFHRYYKKTDINQAICFNSKVNDSIIRRAVLDMFPKTGGGKEPAVGTKKKPGPLYGFSSHMYPALAVALTHALREGLISYVTY